MDINSTWNQFKESIINHRSQSTPTTRIFSNMAILTGGSLLAKALGFVTVPVISRLYSPEDFGLLAVYASTLALLTPFSNLRYSVAVPLARSERSAVHLMFLCFIIQCIFSSAIALVLFFFQYEIFAYFSIQKLTPYWVLLPLGFFGFGLYETLVSWGTRRKTFGLIAKTRVSQSFTSALVKIALGFIGLRPFGLLLGHFFTQCAGITLLLKSMKETISSSQKKISLKKTMRLAARYSKFSQYQIPSRFLLSFAVQLPVLFIAATFDPQTTGNFGMAVHIVAIPMQLFGQTLSQAYYAEIAAIGKNRPAEIRSLSLNLMRKISLVSIPFFILFVFFAPTLFRVILGKQWHEAGFLASILSFSILTQFISSPFVHTLNVLELQGIFLIINISRIAIIFTVLLMCSLINLSSHCTVLIYSLALSAHYVLVMIITLLAAKTREVSDTL